MTEDGSAVKRQQDEHKFLSKHRWRGKIWSNDEALAKEANQKFRLKNDQDLADFLRPSTNKGQPSPPKAPRIDTVSAQRWPGATDIRRDGSPALPPSLRHKENNGRPRRPSLTVAFVKTAPEIIGEGGDEAETPAIAVSERKAAAQRQELEKKSRPQDDGGVGLADRTRNGFDQEPSHDDASDFQPRPLRRAQTSYQGNSGPPPPPPPSHKKRDSGERLPPPQAAPQEERFRPMPLKRAPTCFPASNDAVSRPGVADEDQFRPGPIRRTQTGYVGVAPEAEPPPRLPELSLTDDDDDASPSSAYSNTFTDTEPANPSSFAARLQHKMRAEEGKALHEGAQKATRSSPEAAQRPPTSSSGYSTGSPEYEPSAPSKAQYDPPASKSKPPVAFYNGREGYSQQRPSSASSNKPSYFPPSRSQAARSPSQTALSPRDLSSAQFSRQEPPSLRSRPSPQVPPLSSQNFAPNSADSEAPHSPPYAPEQYSLSMQTEFKPSPQPSPYITDKFVVTSPQSESDQFMKIPMAAPGSQDAGMHPAAAKQDARSTADEAMEDFADRVVHMRGIFRLTADIERPRYEFTPLQWLRAGIWWFLKGRAGLEVLIRNRPKGPDGRPISQHGENKLSQPHVDLAKTWWIVTEIMEEHPKLRRYSDSLPGSCATLARDAGDYEMAEIYEVCDVLMASLKALMSSMRRNKVMPPEQALIQGQDQSIWVKYPKFAPDVCTVLSGQVSKSLIADTPTRHSNPLTGMPLADSKTDFCYGRMFVQVSLTTDEEESDRVSFSCVLSILRPRNEWALKVAICSQGDLVDICIQNDKKQGPTWEDVMWKTRYRGLYVRLPRGFTLNVELGEKDFRSLWGIYDYIKNVEASLEPASDEILVHDATLRDFHYSDGTKSQAFPAERVRRCKIRIFEKLAMHNEGTGQRRLHRGHRFLIVTPPRIKTISSIAHGLGRDSPISFEYKTDGSGERAPVMALRLKEDKKNVNMLCVFNDVKERSAVFAVLNGMRVGPDEAVIVQVPFKGLTMLPGDQAATSSQPGLDSLQQLEWQDVRVINLDPEDDTRTILSESMRVILRHSAGTLTDRMNLSPGELQLRLDTRGSAEISLLRNAQEDITMSFDHQKLEPNSLDSLSNTLRAVTASQTIRKYTFHGLKDLHEFQTAITGFLVKYDGVASTFAIARRRMVVPIYKKWEANTVRIQIVQHDNVVQLLAFFEDFSHADCMNFQLRAMDVFEKVERGGKHCIRLVDAKFALPPEKEKGKAADIRRKFACLDLPEYAGEHDDITIGFDSIAQRDRFAASLPAATQVTRMMTLKRKI